MVGVFSSSFESDIMESDFGSSFAESTFLATPAVQPIPVEVILVNEDDTTLSNEDDDILTILT